MLNPFEQLLEELEGIRKEQENLKSLLVVNNNCHQTEIIDTGTLCMRLGITEPTAIRHRKRGLIPFLQIGSAIRFNWPAVVKALERNGGRRHGK
jgi:hypothetical protein